MQKALRTQPATASHTANRQHTGKIGKSLPAVPAIQMQSTENKTGMPHALKQGVEQLSGISMNDVRVHYNSGKPAQLRAFAFAQGTDIHVAPGQEKHLPHEAWHVVQQKQGRVQPTMQLKDGSPVNNNPALESEADVMGHAALTATPAATTQLQPATAPMVNMPFQLTKSMNDINNEQQLLEQSGNLGGDYTSVGLEWNLVELNDENHLLAGMSHIEIAESANGQESLGVPHKLETESGNRIEYVAPPYLVHTKVKGETEPDYVALTELIQAQLTALEQVVGKAKILGDLMGNWPSFSINMEAHKNLGAHISPRNWSMNTNKSYKEVKDKLQGREDDKKEEEIKIEEEQITGDSWLNAKVNSRLLSVKDDYQINVLSDAKSYEDTYGAKQSRINNALWGTRSDLKAYDDLATAFYNSLQEGIPNETENELLPGLNLFHKQFGRVIAQHGVVPLLEMLRDYQDQETNEPGSVKGKDTSKFNKIARITSFIKDMANVWLKTDLLDYGKGLLTSKESWAIESKVLESVKDTLIEQVNSNDVYTSKNAKQAMITFIDNISKTINSIGQEDLELGWGSSTENIEQLPHGPGKLFEHNDDIYGVRQDTFLDPNKINGLNNKLRLNSEALFVMEQRNPEQYREYLRKKQYVAWNSLDSWTSGVGWRSTKIEQGKGYKELESEKEI